MGKIKIKTAREIALMQEGGEKLSKIKKEVKRAIGEGTSAVRIEKLTTRLIKKEGGKPSFKMVKGYRWATCVNVNEGVVHGIPNKELIFKKGDVVSIDMGMLFKGYHTDTSFSLVVGSDSEKEEFLKVGRNALRKAIDMVKPGKRIYDISLAIETVLKKEKLSPIKALVGHGIGKDLHEEPQIPCFVKGKRGHTPEIINGMVLAIEVMYSKGSGDVKLGQDGWTIVTSDGKIAALFEETVAVIKNGNIVLTQ